MTYIIHYLVFIAIYFSYFFPLWHNETKKKLHIHLSILTYLLIVITFTIIPLPTQLLYTNEPLIQSINFIPFRDFFAGYLYAKREILFNILMFLPYGFFIPLLTNKKGLYTIISASLFSTTIEATQLFTIMFESNHPRVVDITDLITNTTGGALGYSLFCFVQNIINRRNL